MAMKIAIHHRNARTSPTCQTDADRASCTCKCRPNAGEFNGSLLIQEAPHLPRAGRVLQLAQRLGLDLADALAGDAELLTDFLQRMVGVHADAEAHAQHAFLARG